MNSKMQENRGDSKRKDPEEKEEEKQGKDRGGFPVVLSRVSRPDVPARY